MKSITKIKKCVPAMIAVILLTASCNSGELYYDPYNLQSWADSLSLYMGKSVYNEGDMFTLYDKNNDPISFTVKSNWEDGAIIVSGNRNSKYRGEINSKIMKLEISSNDHTIDISITKVEKQKPSIVIIWDDIASPKDSFLPMELDFSNTRLPIADKTGNAAILERGVGITYLFNAESHEEWSLQKTTEATN